MIRARLILFYDNELEAPVELYRREVATTSTHGDDAQQLSKALDTLSGATKRDVLAAGLASLYQQSRPGRKV